MGGWMNFVPASKAEYPAQLMKTPMSFSLSSMAAEQFIALWMNEQEKTVFILIYLNSVDNIEDDWGKLQGEASYRCWGVLVCIERSGGADTGKTVEVYFIYTHSFYITWQITPKKDRNTHLNHIF